MIPRRLDKFLADATALSRRDINAAWEAGRIEVRPAEPPWQGACELWHPVFEDDTVLLDGEPVEVSPPAHYYALHKPAGVLSTTSDPDGRPCLARWLDDLPAPVFPVGRLDMPTTGLLLLIDDGDLCFCLLNQRFHVEKAYHLTVGGRVTPADPRLERLEAGIDIGDKRPPAAALRAGLVESTRRRSIVSVVVDEGRHRMVRRMARRADLHLEHLHRVRIGPLDLGDLGSGECRELAAAEVDALWEAAGGREASRQRTVAALAKQAANWREEGRPHERLEGWLENFD